MSFLFRRVLKNARRQALSKAQRLIRPTNPNKLTFIVDSADRNRIRFRQLRKPIIVQFNPENFDYTWNVKWSDADDQGNKLSNIQFQEVDQRNLTVNLIFDAREAGVDAVNELIKPLELLSKPSIGRGSDVKSRPPVFRMYWGHVEPIRGVLKAFTKQYTLFSNEGVPLRAKVSLNIQEFVDPQQEQQLERAGDPEEFFVVSAGENLPIIAFREYGNASLWRIIADANNIPDIFNIPTGTQLFIPALDTVE